MRSSIPSRRRNGGAALPDIIAETDRLILRTIEEGDAAEQYRLLNTPAVMARLGGPKELHEIEAKHALSMAQYAQEGFSFLMMVEKAGGDLVGHCGLKRVTNPLAPNLGDHEIGWLVREDRWRRGYAEEAVRAVLGWAFTRIGAPHVVALTSEANTASWRLMEKLGMERRPDLDFADPAYPPEDNPTIQYSLASAQWETVK
jgi:RimJ/RimL family protein N-acetyltransferase